MMDHRSGDGKSECAAFLPNEVDKRTPQESSLSASSGAVSFKLVCRECEVGSKRIDLLLPAMLAVLLIGFGTAICAAQSPDPYRLDDGPSTNRPTTNPSSRLLAQSQDGGQDNSTAQDASAQDADSDSSTDSGNASESAPQDPQAAVENSIDETTEQAKETFNKIAAGDFAAAADSGWALLIRFGVPTIVALVLLIVAYFVASFLARICSLPVRRRVDETLGRFIAKLVFYGVMICALLGVLQYFGIGVTSFAAVVAAAGFAIGLAFQGTLSNFAAGVMLLVFRPFKVGDVVNAAGLTAKVYEIDLFTTIFDTFDNRRIIVPNSEISSGIIENISHHRERRVDVAVGVEYPASIAKTRQTLEAAAASLREHVIEGDDRGYQVVLGDLGDSAVQWTVRFWTYSDQFWPVKEKLTEAVKNHLDEAGIGIPFPQMDVHLYRADDKA